MVAGSVTEECPMAVSAELLWKVVFAGDKTAILPKACVGMIDAVEVEGDGGPGTVTTIKLAAAVSGPTGFKTRLLSRDDAARVVRLEMTVEGGAVAAQLKSQVSEVKVVPAGEGACVAKITTEYERLDGAPLSPEDEAKLVKGYLGLIKKVEEYLVAHPGEFA